MAALWWTKRSSFMGPDPSAYPAELAVLRSLDHQARGVLDSAPANQIAQRDNSQTRTQRYPVSSAPDVLRVTKDAARSARQQP